MPADIVNPQVTDAVTQSNVKVISEAPALALGSIYQSLANATGLMMHNAVNAQQQANITAQAATTQGVIQIYSILGRDAAAHMVPDEAEPTPPASAASRSK